MHEIFLHLGSNLGNREKYLADALSLINSTIGKVDRQSSLYETVAWGKTDQPDFINQAVSLKSSISPMKLLEAVLSIEGSLYRKREERWAARTIDVDILFYGSEIIDMRDLIIPHRLLHERRFVLMPMCEIAPDLKHPILEKTMRQLLLEVTDELPVKKIEKYI